jgi:hypothetical protein
MAQAVSNALAIAFIEGQESWKWHLKIDGVGLFRWYLQREIWTNLRGATRADAENKLRRFANECLSGELRIVDVGEPVRAARARNAPAI